MTKNEFCYMLCATADDLPVLVFDEYIELMEYLDIQRTTAWKMIKKGVIIKGYYVEKVLL